MAGYNPPSIRLPPGTTVGGGSLPRAPIGSIAGGGGGKKSRGPVNGGRPHGSRGGGRPHGGGKPPRGHGGGNRGHGGGHGHGGGGNRGGGANTNALYDPTQILSGDNLGNAAQSIADAQTVGPISEFAKQIASNNQDSAGIQKQDFDYYMQLAKDAQDYVNGIPAAGLQQAAAMQGINNQTQTQLGQIGSQAQQGLGRFPGQGGQANQDLTALTAQQRGIATLNQQAANNLGATTFNNNLNAAKQQQANIGLAGQERIGQVALAGQRANEPLNAKIAGLQASRGALKATAIGQLRQAERNYLVAQQGLGLKSQANQITAAQNVAKNALTIRGQNVTKRGQDFRHATDEQRIAAELRGQNITSKRDLLNYTLGSEQLAEKTHNDQASQLYHQMELNLRAAQGSGRGGGRGRGGGGARPLTTLENNTAWKSIGEATAAIDHIRQNGIKENGKVTVRHPSEAQIRGLLGQGYHPEFVEAAYELKGWGALTAQTAKALHAMGIRGGTYNGRPIRIRNQVGRALGGALRGRHL